MKLTPEVEISLLSMFWQPRFQALWSINNYDDDSDSIDDSVSDPEIVIEIPAKKMRREQDEISETSTKNSTEKEEGNVEKRTSVDKPAAKPAVIDDYRPPDDVDDVSFIINPTKLCFSLFADFYC